MYTKNLISFSSKVIADFATAFLGLLLAYYIRFHVIHYNLVPGVTPNFNQYMISFLVMSSMWTVIFYLLGSYNTLKKFDIIDNIYDTAKGCFIGLVFTILPVYFYQKGSFSRLVLIIGTITAFILINLEKTVLFYLFKYLHKHGLWKKKCLIVGSGDKAHMLQERISLYPDLGHNILGFIKFNGEKTSLKISETKIIGNISQIPEIVQNLKIEEIIIAPESHDKDEILNAISYCSGLPTHIFMIPSLYDVVIGSVRTNQIYGFPLIEIFPDIIPAWQENLKRFVDVIFALATLTLFSPLWLLISILIKTDSKGPILYKQERIGKDFKPFMIYKFRTMVDKAEQTTGPVWADKDDPRITKTGRFLRKCRLDEFPQFLNVIKGDMSVIGPRPERKFFVDQFKSQIPLYVNRLKVKPGITGWAQVKHKYDTSIDDVREKLKYDLYYIENYSIKIDVKIFFETIIVVLFRGNKQAH